MHILYVSFLDVNTVNIHLDFKSFGHKNAHTLWVDIPTQFNSKSFSVFCVFFLAIITPFQ